jgi:hypothetical protein
MTSRHVLTLVVLAIWIMAGPIAMAFDGCAAMGAMCEGPCGSTACSITALPVAAVPEVLDAVVAGAVQSAPEGIARAVDLPPRSVSLLS